MPHVRTIIVGKLESIRGNATTGFAADLLTSVNNAYDYRETDPPPENIAALDIQLEIVEDGVLNGVGLSAGVAEAFKTFKNDLNDLIS